MPLPKPLFRKDGQVDVWPENALVAAYWWVCPTIKETEANMEEKLIVKNGISIPVLQNPKALEPHTKLWKYKPAEKIKGAGSAAAHVSNEPPTKKGESMMIAAHVV